MLTAVVVLALGGSNPSPTPPLRREGLQTIGAPGYVSGRAEGPAPPPFLGEGVGGRGSALAPPPRPAPLRATAADGAPFVWPPAAPGKAACLVFVGTDCPLANAYAPEINRLVAGYGPKGVTFAVVYPLPDLAAGAVQKHAKEYGFACPALPDRELRVAKRVGATTTPEAVVLSPAGDVLYRGRIDDRYPKAGGRRRENPTTFDLRDALDAALAGRTAPKPWPPAVGCHIDFPD